MNVVDSSGWLEFFADGPNADHFAGPICQPDDLVVPTVTLYEVFKVVLRQRGEQPALRAIAQMRRGDVVPLSESLALSAARTSVEESLPMADGIILATARAFGAAVWTQDEDFAGKDDVRYVRRQPAPPDVR